MTASVRFAMQGYEDIKTEEIKSGDRFRFEDESKNIGQDWYVTGVFKVGDNIIVCFVPETTPVANDSMFKLGGLKFKVTVPFSLK